MSIEQGRVPGSPRLMASIFILPLVVVLARVPAVAQESVSTLTATVPSEADAKAAAAAKKKADRARMIAERDAREAAEYSGLGSHIRGGDSAGSRSKVADKAQLDRLSAGMAGHGQPAETGQVP